MLLFFFFAHFILVLYRFAPLASFILYFFAIYAWIFVFLFYFPGIFSELRWLARVCYCSAENVNATSRYKCLYVRGCKTYIYDFCYALLFIHNTIFVLSFFLFHPTVYSIGVLTIIVNFVDGVHNGSEFIRNIVNALNNKITKSNEEKEKKRGRLCTKIIGKQKHTWVNEGAYATATEEQKKRKKFIQFKKRTVI